MSERFTSIRLRDVFGSGIADRGRLPVPEMIEQVRRWATHNKTVAEAILNAPGEDFHVATYIGAYVEKNREVLQEGRPKDAAALAKEPNP